jgi:hypothetical protein
MKIIEIQHDIAIMEDDGLIFIASLDAFESGNYSIGSYIMPNGLPRLVNKFTHYGNLIEEVLKSVRN